MAETRNVRAELVCAARQACKAFHSRSMPGLDVEHIFCTTPIPAVEEHGPPGICPFIGQRFTGVDKVKCYFELASQMSIEKLQLPPVGASAGVGPDSNAEIPPSLSDRWLVDVEEKAVVVVGAVTLASPDRQHIWTGKVSFHLRFVEQQRREVEKSGWRIEQMEIWNDASTYCLARYNKPTDFLEQPGGSSRVGPVSDKDLDVDLGGP